MTKQQHEAALAHTIMEAELCLHDGVSADVERVLRASIKQAKRELQQLRASW